jgi:hypothetical protein
VRKIFAIAVLMLSASVACKAQQISPLYSEGKLKTKSQFSVTNLGVSNLPVSIEARELKIVEGKIQFIPPTGNVHVQLQDTSAVISPKSTRTFDYKASCDGECMFIIMAGMTTGKSKEGIVVKLWLPTSIYLCTDTAKDCRKRIREKTGLDKQ